MYIPRVLFLFLGIPMLVHAQIHLHGSSGLYNLLKPHLNDIQAKTGVSLEILGDGTGRGLLDLSRHRSDGALVGGSLSDDLAVLMNDPRFSELGTMDLVETEVLHTPLHFIVNNSVPVTTLTLDQSKHILTGEITNWNQVGGPDMTIIVIAPLPTDGARANYSAHLLKGQDLSWNARLVRNSSAVVVEVGKTPGAFAITDAPVSGNVRLLTTDKPLMQIFSIVTLGDPTGDLSKVIDEVRLAFK